MGGSLVLPALVGPAGSAGGAAVASSWAGPAASAGGAVYNVSIDLPSVMVAHDASTTVANCIFANSVGGEDVRNVQYNGTATITATGPNIASAAVVNTGGTVSGPAFTVANPNLGT